MDEKVHASAKVTLTVEVPVRSGWGQDCPISQVHRQAADEAWLTVTKLVESSGVRIVGTPKVQAVLVERNER
jgi:hypothetical protein